MTAPLINQQPPFDTATKNNIVIGHHVAEKHFPGLCKLYQSMWWSQGRTAQDIQTLIHHSRNYIATNQKDELVGFTRVLTDYARLAVIMDVMVCPKARGQGIGKQLITHILNDPRLKNIKYFELTCEHRMISYYQRFGFHDHLGEVVAMRYTAI